MSEIDPYNARLVERQDLTDELAIFRVAYEDGPVPPFDPGQYATIGLIAPPEEQKPANPNSPRSRRRGPKLIRRAYSIASSPKQTDALDFYIVRVDEGKLTPKLWEIEPGARMFMDPKIRGHFTINGVPEGKDLVMISTGTGLAPYMSMLKTYRGTGKWRRFIVIHGTRLAADLGYREELEQIAREDPSVVYLPICTREPDTSNWQGLRGRVHVILEPAMFEKLVGTPLSAETAHIFLCGNPAMIDQCEEELQDRGFVVRGREHPDGNIHFERYW